MPNHYANMIIVTMGRDQDRAEWLAGLAAFGRDPFASARPMPQEIRIVGAAVELGAYDAVSPVELPGDGGPVMLAFSTAWAPGHAAARSAIEQYARANLNCATFVWIGFDPSDDSVQLAHGEIRIVGDAASVDHQHGRLFVAPIAKEAT